MPSTFGLILDFDDTLIDSERAYRIALLAVKIDPLGEPYSRAKREVKARLPAKHISTHNRLLYFKAMLENEGRYTPAALLDLIGKYETALSLEMNKQWIDLKRPELFSKLSQKFEIVVVTNETARTQVIKQNALDPQANFIGRIVTSEEMGVEKPAPQGFLRAAEWIGRPLSECFVVGNDVEADLLPAMAYGASGILSAEFTGKSVASPGVRIIQRLDELLGLK